MYHRSRQLIEPGACAGLRGVGLALAAAAGVVLLPMALMAGPVAPAPGVWVAKGTGICQFTLQGYPLSAESGAVINTIVTDLVHRHEQAFGFTVATNFHVYLRIFGKHEDFLAYASDAGRASGETHGGATGSHGPGLNAKNLAGYYSVLDREVVTWRQRDPSYLANNILHECSHAITASQFRYLPIWLNEGCAVYFSFPQQMQDADDLRTLRLRWEALGEWLKAGTLPKLKSFLNVSSDAFRAQDPELMYTTSWSVFQFLMSTPENRRVMNKLVDVVQDTEKDPADCAGIIGGSYPGGLAKFERDWHGWIRRGAAIELKKTEDR